MKRWIDNGVRLAWRIYRFGGKLAIFSVDADVVVLDRPAVVVGMGPVVGFA